MEKENRQYFPNGKLRSLWTPTHYTDWRISGSLRQDYETDIAGRKNGLYKMYFNNGSLFKEFNYLKDKLHGAYKIYDDNGDLREDCNYENGVKVGESKTWKDGKLESHCIWENGVPRSLI